MERCRCRVCLTNSGSFYDIFDNCKASLTYADNIRHIAEVEVERDDGLPQQICVDCCAELSSIYEFGLLIRQGDEKLRKELEERNLGVDEENVQILEDDCFLQDDEVDMQVCVLEEEVLDGDLHEQHEMTVVECVKEDHDVDELQMVEEIIEVDEEVNHNPIVETSIPTENDLLVELAQVAATQENVLIDHHVSDNKLEADYYNEDECDDDYLVAYNPAEEALYNFKPPKWKCGECKTILRGDVSYEGHMNIHKQLRPHKCSQCQCQFRCRSALKKHKEVRHSNTPATTTKQQAKTEETSIVNSKCIECNEECQNDVDLLLHELLVHDNRSNITTCPFCPDLIVDNLVDHLKYAHVVKTKPASTNELQTVSEEIDQMHQDAGDESEDNRTEGSDTVVHCEICKRKLLRRNLLKHMVLHKRKDKETDNVAAKYLCAYCPREFKNAKYMHQHEKTHQGESSNTVYVCGDCDRQYPTQFLLETHRKQAHKERDHVCSICGNAFKLKNQLVNHMKLHLEKNISCPHCDKKYARQFDLNVHLRSHTGEMPYACHLCDKRFAIKVRLTYHLQKHYGIKHQCKECQAEFNSKQKLKAHSFKHTGMPYRCELCDDHGFATRVVFKRHLNRVHHATMSDEALTDMFQRNTGKTIKIKQITEPSDDVDEEMILSQLHSSCVDLKDHVTSEHVPIQATDNMYFEILHECAQCKKVFDDLDSLKKHEKSKVCTEQKYICKECGNLFGGHAQLSAHKRLHKERPYKCDQCDKAYPRKVELEIHMRTHTGELPYGCHLCNKRFAIKVRLTYHLQKHEGVKHCCHFCDAVYDNRNKLKAHLFKHTGMPYKCELCPGLEFERRLRFANHMQRYHQRILTEEELAEIFAKNTGKTVRFKTSGKRNL